MSEYSDTRGSAITGFVRENRDVFDLGCQSTLTTLLHEQVRGDRPEVRAAKIKNEVTDLLCVDAIRKSFVRGN